MKILSFTVGLMLMLGASAVAGDSEWTCFARDAIGTKYAGESEDKGEAKSLALGKCKRETTIGSCHQLFDGECQAPRAPTQWTCYARDAVGTKYPGKSEDKAEAKSVALNKCKRDSSIGNCHQLFDGECDRD